MFRHKKLNNFLLLLTIILIISMGPTTAFIIKTNNSTENTINKNRIQVNKLKDQLFKNSPQNIDNNLVNTPTQTIKQVSTVKKTVNLYF
jgi:hypothetical protein